jgi:hypothetical protein
VQHAHQKGVVHRDLKPSNILVTLHDGVPVPKVIDFGIAKATDRKLTEKTLVTQFHAFVGTPVLARPPSATYEIGKFVRRHRVGVAAGAAVALSLLGGLVVSSLLFVRERTAHGRAAAAEQAEGRLRQQAEAARTAEAKRASRTSQALAERLVQDGRTGEGLAHLVRGARADPENYGVGLRLISALVYRSFALPIGEPIPEVQSGGYSKMGRRFWTYSADGTVRFHDLLTGQPLQSYRVADVVAGQERPDGRHWAIGRAERRSRRSGPSKRRRTLGSSVRTALCW